MFTLSDAKEIAIKYLKSHFPNVLSEGVLISQYYNPDFNRFVFQWSHKKGILYSEPELAVVWVSDTGEILKVSITWSPFEPSLLALTRDDCVRMENRVRVVSADIIPVPISFEIIGYHRIDKNLYLSFSGAPLHDWYWIGKAGKDIYLVDEHGRIVGVRIPPPSESFSVSGIIGCWYSDSEVTWHPECWNYIINIADKYFSKWFDNTKKCLAPPVTKDELEPLYTDPALKTLLIVSHGHSYWTFISRYTTNTYCSPDPTTEPNPDEWCLWATSSPPGGETVSEHDLVVRDMLASRTTPIPLSILYHCHAMNDKGPGYFEYEYRKGSTTNTVVVGLKDTTTDSWAVAHTFLENLLSKIDNDWDKKIWDAYNEAVDETKAIKDHIDFSGDKSLTLRKIGPTKTPTPTPTATPTPTPTPTPRFVFITSPTIYYNGRYYKLNETLRAPPGSSLVAYADIKEVNDAAGWCTFRVDNYDTGELLCSSSKFFNGYDAYTLMCSFDMPAESTLAFFSACYGDTPTDQAGWILLVPATPTPTPTSTPTPTPTGTPTPSLTPTPTPTLPPITGECVFPRLITGTLTPRLDKGKVFYRVRCIIDKWGI